MIVLWGVPGDGPLDAVHARLSHLGANFRLLDQRSGARSSATIRIERRDLVLEIEGPSSAGRLDFKNVGAAYLRPIETERALPSDAGDDRAARVRADGVDRALIAWADLTTALAVNPPTAMAANNSKPYQLAADQAVRLCRARDAGYDRSRSRTRIRRAARPRHLQERERHAQHRQHSRGGRP